MSNDFYTAHHNSSGICHQLKIRHLYGTFNFSTQCICMGTGSLFVCDFHGKARPLQRNTVFAVARILANGGKLTTAGKNIEILLIPEGDSLREGIEAVQELELSVAAQRDHLVHLLQVVVDGAEPAHEHVQALLAHVLQLPPLLVPLLGQRLVLGHPLEVVLFLQCIMGRDKKWVMKQVIVRFFIYNFFPGLFAFII